MEAERPRERTPDHAYLGGVVALACATLAGVLAWGALTATREWLSLQVLALVPALTAASFLILRNVVTFDWRGQRVALAPDETLVFLALLALPTPLVVAFAIPSMAAYQVVTKRDLLKGAFNVANLVLSTTVCALAFLALRDLARAPPLVAAAFALVPYTITTHFLVSGVFARRERVPTLRVYRERFAHRWIPGVAMGAAVGTSLLALWSVHPLAVIAIVPFALIAREYVRLGARAEREAATHQKLGTMARDLVGERSAEVVAARVVSLTGELLRAGRVTLALADLPEVVARDFEHGPRPSASPIEEAIVGREGLAIGRLSAYPPASTHEAYGDVDRSVLRTIAAEAAQAIENARALRDLERAQEERVSLVAREKEIERLRDLDELKTRFLHMAAHDLGTPLTPIGLRLHMLKSSSLGEKDADSVRIIDRNFARLRALVGDLLDAARLQATRMSLARSLVDVDEVARDAVESFADVAKEKDVSLAFEPGRPPPISADPRRLAQILFNLLSNAIKFTPPGGSVLLRTERARDRVLLVVRDTGRGLTEEQIAGLFQPFAQVHEPRSGPAGTGLGLYVSKGLAELHGGALACASDGPGKGATFTVSLPLSA